jgi:hypothetical protein
MGGVMIQIAENNYYWIHSRWVLIDTAMDEFNDPSTANQHRMCGVEKPDLDSVHNYKICLEPDSMNPGYHMEATRSQTFSVAGSLTLQDVEFDQGVTYPDKHHLGLTKMRIRFPRLMIPTQIHRILRYLYQCS